MTSMQILIGEPVKGTEAQLGIPVSARDFLPHPELIRSVERFTVISDIESQLLTTGRGTHPDRLKVE